MDSATQLLRESVRHWLTTEGMDVMRTLSIEDWSDTVADDPRDGWGVLLEEWARALSPAPVLDLFVLHALGLPASGTSVVYPTGSPVPPSQGDVQLATGYVHGPFTASTLFVWLHADGSAAACYGPDELGIRPVEGLDADLGIGIATLAEPPRSELDPDAVRSAVSGARLLQAFALLALGEHMQRTALDHVTARHQFGRPLASFQAVKHHLAESELELEAARVTIDYAAESRDAYASLVARSNAGRGASVAARTAQQLLGAMGFAWETPLHRYVRRAQAIDLFLGPWEHLMRELGERVIDGRHVPRLGSA